MPKHARFPLTRGPNRVTLFRNLSTLNLQIIKNYLNVILMDSSSPPAPEYKSSLHAGQIVPYFFHRHVPIVGGQCSHTRPVKRCIVIGF